MGAFLTDADFAIDSPRNIPRLLTRVRFAVLEALDRELAPFDISAAQLIVLALVANGEATSASSLCKGISYDPGAMTRMLDRLEQKGLIRRRPDPDDRRTTKLELTDEGRALYPELAATKSKIQRQFLKGFTEAEVDTLARLLGRMYDNR